MNDKRIEILCREFDPVFHDCTTIKEDLQLAITLNPDIDKINNAMDENGRRLCLELLEYMANNNVRITYNVKMQPIFEYKGEWITAEQLFENFL